MNNAARKTKLQLNVVQSFEQILNSISDLILVKGEKSKIVWANQAFCEYYGMSNDQLNGIIDAPFNEPDYTQQYIKDDAYVFETGRTLNIPEEKVTRYDGYVGTFHTVKSPILDLSGKTILTVGVSRDITAQKLANEQVAVHAVELNKAFTFMNAVIENIPDMIFIKEAKDLRFVRLNKAGEELLGYSTQDLIGKNDHDFFPKPEADFFLQADRSVLTSGKLLDIPEEEIQTRNKGKRFLHTKKIPLLGENGTPEFLLGISEDITEKKTNEAIKNEFIREQAARVSSENAHKRSHFLAESSKVLASSLDYESIFERVASLSVPLLAEWCTVFDLALNRVTAKHVDPSKMALIYEMDRRFPVDPIKPTVLEKVMRTGHSELIQEITDEALASLARGPEHLEVMKNLGMRSSLVVPMILREQVLGLLVLFSHEAPHFGETEQILVEELALRAATAIENARLYREAQQSIKAREAILGIVSHDLKNPVTAIRLATQLLEKLNSLKNDSEFKPLIQSIAGSTEQMMRLIGDLVDFSKIQIGKLFVVKQPEDPQTLINSALEMMKPQAESKGLVLLSHPNPDLPQIACDKQRVLQVFSNLLGNAIKFTEKGSIEILAKTNGGTVQFSVKDTGPGISPDEIPKIFENFWQANKTKTLGTGLGLFIARGIINSHGGRIWADSHLGEGSTFHFTIPIEATTEDRKTL